MGELRKDYILDRWVIVSTGRAHRPKQFRAPPTTKEVKVCYFCPGNEELTPPEIGRVEENGEWIIRWFPNKFAAVEPKGTADVKTDDTYFTFSANYGHHEVIVETPDHEKQIADLPLEHLKKVFEVYNQRIEELGKKDNIKYVVLFKNYGQKAGTSIVHTHTQIAAVNHVPKHVRDKIEAVKKFDHCPYCDIINIEKQSDRRCYENNSFVAFTPYASRFNYEIWVFPKQHITKMSECNFDDLTEIMHNILNALHDIGESYNFFIHYAPEGEDLHFHIEVCPRIATWAGFELNSETIINSVSPEDAASFYRGEQ